MDTYNNLCEFYNSRRVLVTGHTGFKGSYLCRILLGFGANVLGYSLPAPTEPAIFKIVLENLADEGQLMSYRHEGFWQCMDTMREKTMLLDMWNNGKAPWRVW